MKSITISDEVYALLTEIAKQVQTQDNRATANPLFCVYEKRKVIDADGSFSGYTDEDGNIINDDDVNDDIAYKEYRNEAIDQTREEIITGLGWKKIEYNIEDIPVSGQVYLTELGAKAHIECNHYHYHKPFVFVEGAWRNPEIKLLREVLLGMVK